MLLAIASIGMLRAENDTVLIGNLYYILDAARPEATVTYKSANATAQSTYAIGDLTIPSSVTYNGQDYTVISIGQAAFANCTGLTSVVVPQSVRSLVGDPRAQFTGSFYNCQNLRSVTLPDTLSYFGAYSFSYCLALEEINIPVVDDIFPDVFQNCESLKRVVIPEGAWRISNHAFDGCRGMQFVEIPSTVERIGENAFANCISLDTVCCLATTPPQLDGETPGKEVFYHSGKARGQNTYYGIKYMKVFVPLESINAYKGAKEWSDCLNIYAIGYDVYESNGLYFKRDPLNRTAEVTWKAYEFNGSPTEQVNYVSGDLVIPETFTDDHGVTYTVTSIGEHAFAGCRYLTSVQMPNTITVINEYAFAFCYSLASVIFPTGLLSIGECAFDNTHLTSITLPDGLQTINFNAFLDCSYLTELELPSSITEIGSGAFARCTSLRKIFARMTTPPAIEATVFNGCASDLKDIKCYVPDAAFSAFETAGAWNNLDLLLMSSYKLPISLVSMTVVWPQMGTAVTSNVPYGPNDITTTTLPEDIHYAFNSFYFYDADGNTFTETTLQPRTTYTVRVTVSAAIGYEFADDVVISINRAAPTQRNNTGATLSFVTSFTTTNGQTIVSDGGLTGLFSISEDKKVVFSKGNLQYHAVQDKWQFAEHQYDTIGSANANISPTYDGWIDLFGWGTGNNPTLATDVNADYATFTDWGVNAISNGGNAPNLWRTMTDDEWNYIVSGRSNAADLIGNANLNGVRGIILLPDNFVCPITASFTTTKTNTYTLEQWADMEAEGAVFLPCTSYRMKNFCGNDNWGYYWTSSSIGGTNAIEYCFSRSDKTLTRETYNSRYTGYAVRLVQEPRIEINTVALDFEFPQAGQTVSKIVLEPSDEEYNVVGKVTLPAGANYEVRSYSFFDNNGNRFTGTFEAGATYKVVVELQPKEGYIFPPSASNPNYADADQINCTVNGEAPMALNTWNDGSIGPKFSFTILPPTYTVRFIDWDGTILSEQTVSEGEDAVAPADPTRAGFVFSGWDQDFTNITANTYITAQYKQIVSDVVLSFDFPNAGQAINKMSVTPTDEEYNVIGRVTLPAGVNYEVLGYSFFDNNGSRFTGTFAADVTYRVVVELQPKEGYIFPPSASNPNYADADQINCTVNGEAPMALNTWNDGSIGPKFSFTILPPTYTVRFIDWDGTILSEQTVSEGEDAVAPADPTRAGFVFSGWDQDFTNITANTFVSAQYKQIVSDIVLSFDFPKAGQSADNGILLPSNEKFNVVGHATLPAGVNYAFAKYSFYDSNNANFTTAFVADETYTVRLIVRALDGFTFPMRDDHYADKTQMTYTVNGNLIDADALHVYNDGTVGADVSFTAEALYTVRFLDWDGTVLSTQTVLAGEDAVAPAFPSHSGYYFAGWDREFTNVQANIDVTAQYLQAIYEINPTFVFPAAGDTVTNDVMTPTHELYNVLGQISVPDGAPFHVRSYQFTDANSNYINSNSFGANGVYSVQIILEPNEGYAFNTTYEWDWGSVTFSVNGQAPYAAMAAPEGGLRLWVRFETGKISIKNISLTTEFPDYGDSIKSGPYYCDECTMPLPMPILSGDADAYYCEGVDLWEVNYDPFEEEALLPNKTYLVRFYVYPKEGHTILKTLTENDITVNGEHPFDVGTDNQDRMWFSVNFTTSKMLIDAVDLTVVTPNAGDAVTSCNHYDPDLSTIASINCPPGAPYSCSLFVFYKDGECFEETELLPNTEYIMGIELTPAEGYTFPKVIWPGTGVEYVANEQIGFTINGVDVTCGEFTVDVARCYLNFTTGDNTIREIHVSLFCPSAGDTIVISSLTPSTPGFDIVATVPDTANYHVQAIELQDANQNLIEVGHRVLSFTEYILMVEFCPNTHYRFPVGDNHLVNFDEMSSLTANGQEMPSADLYSNSATSVFFNYRFTTGQAEGIEEVDGDNVQSTKVLRDGILYILRNGRIYDGRGQLVE